jgi:L-seryl-tRNA(Ser) seleniumtransferase
MSSGADHSHVSRRSFLRWSQTTIALVGVAPLLRTTEAIAATPADTAAEDYYDKLGVAKIINAAGTYTTLTAAVMPPEVRRAIEQSALHPVYLHDLREASGAYLAKKLRCEGTMVTSARSRSQPLPAWLSQTATRELPLTRTRSSSASGCCNLASLRSSLDGCTRRLHRRHDISNF